MLRQRDHVGALCEEGRRSGKVGVDIGVESPLHTYSEKGALIMIVKTDLTESLIPCFYFCVGFSRVCMNVLIGTIGSFREINEE